MSHIHIRRRKQQTEKRKKDQEIQEVIDKFDERHQHDEPFNDLDEVSESENYSKKNTKEDDSLNGLDNESSERSWRTHAHKASAWTGSKINGAYNFTARNAKKAGKAVRTYPYTAATIGTVASLALMGGISYYIVSREEANESETPQQIEQAPAHAGYSQADVDSIKETAIDSTRTAHADAVGFYEDKADSLEDVVSSLIDLNKKWSTANANLAQAKKTIQEYKEANGKLSESFISLKRTFQARGDSLQNTQNIARAFLSGSPDSAAVMNQILSENSIIYTEKNKVYVSEVNEKGERKGFPYELGEKAK
ncbi:MAG: hypothetical protein KKC19_03605 [Nanoarchaeota archaeon]|nr:hypothetical protein [Nanoarchaeota archaeon]